MGLLDRFKKKDKSQPVKSDKSKERKRREEELKKKQFQAVPGAQAEAKAKDEKNEAKGPKKAKVSKLDTRNAPRVLIKPVISEKATSLGVNNQYVFEILRETSKIEVKKAIKNLYGVTPLKVNLIKLRGKYTRYGKYEGRTKIRKKAVVTLKPGDKINIYEI